MKPKLRREQILQAATKVFAAKGYHRASVSDIIKTADIARGTFYLYFEGKREIFAELVDVLTVRLFNCMRLVDLAGDKPWQDQIKANILRIASTLIDDRDLTIILYNHAMGLDEEFDKKIQGFYSAMTVRTERAFKMGQDMGLVNRNIDARLMAYNIVGSIKEVVYHAAIGDLKLSIEDMVDQIFEYYINGVMAPVPAKKKDAAKKKGARNK